jgi:hypothetical protein
MPIDASIPLGIHPVQIESPLNQLGQALNVQSAQNQNALAQYGLARAQRQDDETNKLATLLSGGGVDLSTPEGQAKAYSVAPTQAAGYIKGMLENRNIQAQTGSAPPRLKRTASRLKTRRSASTAMPRRRSPIPNRPLISSRTCTAIRAWRILPSLKSRWTRPLRRFRKTRRN